MWNIFKKEKTRTASNVIWEWMYQQLQASLEKVLNRNLSVCEVEYSDREINIPELTPELNRFFSKFKKISYTRLETLEFSHEYLKPYSELINDLSHENKDFYSVGCRIDDGCYQIILNNNNNVMPEDDVELEKDKDGPYTIYFWLVLEILLGKYEEMEDLDTLLELLNSELD